MDADETQACHLAAAAIRRYSDELAATIDWRLVQHGSAHDRLEAVALGLDRLQAQALAAWK
jgi:hypothetical protein